MHGMGRDWYWGAMGGVNPYPPRAPVSPPLPIALVVGRWTEERSIFTLPMENA